MVQLAEDSFSYARRSPEEEIARTEKRKAAESLTGVGSFQPHSVQPRLKAAEGEQEGPQDTSLHVFQRSEVGGAFMLTASLGSTPFVSPDIRLPHVLALKEPNILSRETSVIIITDVKQPFLQRERMADFDVRKSLLGATLFSDIPAQSPYTHKQKVTPGITDEAKKRLAGREHLQEKLLFIVEKEVSGLNATLKRLAFRPGWSHEYEDQSSVVIEVEIANNDNLRFTLWDAISFRLDALLDSLTREDQAFLANNVSVVVTQGEF